MDTINYDVAISFMAADEPFAKQIATALAPLSVFVYSKAQEEVAGTDGAESFREVFVQRARLALILYRPGWGETRFTRVEATAIQDNATRNGWDRMFLVRVGPGDLPRWVPGTHIYFDPATFGLTELVGAVKARAAELGVTLRPLTPAEQARAIAERERFDKQTLDLFTGNPWPDAAAPLFNALDQQIAEITQSTGWEVSSGASGHAEYVFYARSHTLQLLARRERTGIDSHYFLLRHFAGRLLTHAEQQKGLMVVGDPTELERAKLMLRRVPDLGWCWEWDGRVVPSESAAALILGDFLARRLT